MDHSFVVLVLFSLTFDFAYGEVCLLYICKSSYIGDYVFVSEMMLLLCDFINGSFNSLLIFGKDLILIILSSLKKIMKRVKVAFGTGLCSHIKIS